MVGIGGSTFCGPIPEPYSPTGQHHYELAGVDNWIYYAQWPAGTIYPLNWTHGKNWQFTRFPAQGDVNGPQVAPRYAPSPIVADPAFEEIVGPLIHANPLASPAPGFGPNVGPRAPSPFMPGAKGSPSPGVGSEGYTSGEPSGNPNPRPRPRPEPLPSRPGRGEKERKVTGPLARAMLGLRNAYGGLTEVGDLIDVLHDAIDPKCGKKARLKWDPTKPGLASDGKSYRRVFNGKYWTWTRERGAYRAPSLADKAQAIYNNIGCIDVAAAVAGYVENEIEDRILGALGNKAKREAKRRGSGPFPRGFEFGPAL